MGRRCFRGSSLVSIMRDSALGLQTSVCNNTKAIRLLKKWGLTKPETETHGGVDFRKFELCATL
jgi:hypothetical protein